MAASEVLPWFDGARPGPQALQAVEFLAAASSHGLEPRDYAASALKQVVERASDGAPLIPDEAARLDEALTTAMERYLADLHGGRIDPRHIHQRFKPAHRESFDPAVVLRTALAQHRLPEALAEAEPQLPMYGRLREALARYRSWVDHPAWRDALPPLPAGRGAAAAKLEPGQAWDGLALLTKRLVVLGDLVPDTPPPASYEARLVDAVKLFQQRHGLATDGVIGRATLAQLQASPAARARQIELALERLRWTPLTHAPRMVVVNIPEFVLRAYEVQDGRIIVREQMRVIVGKALDTRTPQLIEAMRFVEFSPYWNVPDSIARGELVPEMRRDPGHFARDGFEFVAPGGRVDTVFSTARLDAVLAGQLRIRQRPGPRNALGGIKFIFPNNAAIFLHDTPATALFDRDRRDFSHGCIRVEEPVALARFVLQGQPEWTSRRIRQAMGRGESMTVRLTEPLSVLIAYVTTLVKDGQIYFYDDIYGHDRALDAALRQRTRSLPPPDHRTSLPQPTPATAAR